MTGQSQSPHRASNMFRTRLCPPSPYREAAMPDMPPGEAAEEGTAGHAAVPRAYQFGDYSGLSPDLAGAVRKCVGHITPLAAMAECPNYVIFEQLIPVLDSDGNRIIERDVTPDFVVLTESFNIFRDYKFGRLEPQFAAGHDLQQLTYAVAIHAFYGSRRRVQGGRFHPRLFTHDDQSDLVEFEGDDDYWRGLETALKAIVARSKPDAQAVAGTTQCQYCKAAPICPEYQAWIGRAVEHVAACNDVLTPEVMGRALVLCKAVHAADTRADWIEDQARDAIIHGIVIPHPDGGIWMLKNGKPRRSIEDTLAAAQALSAAGMPAEAIISACKLGIGALETAHRAVTGLKGRAAKDALEASLGNLIVVKHDRPSLIRVTDIDLIEE